MKTLALIVSSLVIGMTTAAADDKATQAKTFDLLRTSMTLFEKGEYDRSEKVIEEALILDSTNPILFAQKNKIQIKRTSEKQFQAPTYLELIDDNTDTVRRQSERVERYRTNQLQSYYPRSMQ